VLNTLNGIDSFRKLIPVYFRYVQLSITSNTASRIASSPPKYKKVKNIIVSEKLKCELDLGNESVRREVIINAIINKKIEIKFKLSSLSDNNE
jgi:hypothetical protein